jgi:hypothetical protein
VEWSAQSDWQNDIRDLAPSIRYTDDVRSDVVARLETVSSQVARLSSNLDQYSPELVGPESSRSSAQSSEQDLRLRTTGKAADSGGHQAGK